LENHAESYFKIFDEETPTVAPSQETRWDGAEPSSSEAHQLPARINQYRILRLLGEGGMGIVYEAEQERPSRSVALKVIKPGFAGPDLKRRFEQEWRALGRLQHPGIAQIYEAGTSDSGLGPQPYFAMELVHGEPLLSYSATRHSNLRERLTLMLKVSEAVHHAHQRGLVHRDLKPANILVDDAGQPKVLDFGVARVTDCDTQATHRTDLGQLVGTLAYMSPEQTLGDPLEIDVRSDVYALGVLLYELLAGRLPYPVSTKLHEAVQSIREEDPTPLSSIDRLYRGDIETIVAKALEKDKARRYASAADLASDIRRYLEDQPIVARPASAAYQLSKFARRHRSLVAGASAVFVVLVAGVVASAWQAARATKASEAALRERDLVLAAEQRATRERDRALSAEKTANAAGAQALEQRNRAVEEQQRADTEAAMAKAVYDFLQNDLLAQASSAAQAGSKSKPDPDLKVRTALDRAAQHIARKFDRQPPVEASLRQTIGMTYLNLGLYTEAQRELERALDLRRRISGEQDPATLTSLISLGHVLHAQGKYPQAEALYERVLEGRRRVLGENHPDTLAAINDLINVYRDETKYPQAAALMVKALGIQRRTLGEEHPEALHTMLNLAAVSRNQGKYPQAEELFTKVLEIQRRTLGDEHPETLATLNLLALQYREEGKYARSEELCAESFELRRRVMGPEHPGTLEAMNLLAILYRVNAKYGQAEAMLRQALDTERRTLGEEHPLTMLSLAELPGVYWVEGKYAEAEPLYVKALEMRSRVLGAEHEDTVSTMNNLATLYLSEGKFEESEPLLTKVLEIRRRVRGENEPHTLTAMNNLGVLYRNKGEYGKAESLFLKVLEARRRVLGEDKPDTLKTLDALAGVYRVQGKYRDAKPLYMQAVEGRRRVLGEQHPDTLVSWNGIALLHLDQGHYSEAEALFTRLLEARRRVLGPDHPDTIGTLDSLGRLRLEQQRYTEAEIPLREALGLLQKKSLAAWERYDTESMLGASLAGQGNFEGAEGLLLSGYQGLSSRGSTIPAPSRSSLEHAVQRIVSLYEAWDKPEQAAEWRNRLRKP
jgi:eukaryotic-like serine/threonine-protein kinase